MAKAFELISTTTVSTAAFSFTLSSIPQTYTDLLLKINARSDYGSAGHEMQITLNSTTTGYTTRMAYVSGSSVLSATSGPNFLTWAGGVVGTSANAAIFSNCEIYFPNYSNTTTAKSMSADVTSGGNTAAGAMWFNSGVNTNTAAISSLTLECWQSFIKFVAGTTFTLYGINKS